MIEDLPQVQALACDSRVYVPNGGETLLRIAKEGTAIQGFIAWQAVADEAELLGIAVAVHKRGQGLGAHLLQDSLDRLCGVKRFFLEVRAGNAPARSLYRRFAFADIGVRRGYYGDEDARVMRRGE